jgi:hypothetical protein
MKTMKGKWRNSMISSSIPLKLTRWLWPLLLISAFLTVLPGTAAACTVTTTADSGPGSLRNCVAYANNNPGDTIAFDIPDTDPGYVTSGADLDHVFHILSSTVNFPDLIIQNSLMQLLRVSGRYYMTPSWNIQL